MRMSPIVPKLIGSMENFTFSICAGMSSASRNPRSRLAASAVPQLAISTHVVPSSARMVFTFSLSSAIRSSSNQIDDALITCHRSHLCIEQTAFVEPCSELLCFLRCYRDQQSAARLGVTHQRKLLFAH